MPYLGSPGIHEVSAKRRPPWNINDTNLEMSCQKNGAYFAQSYSGEIDRNQIDKLRHLKIADVYSLGFVVKSKLQAVKNGRLWV